MGSFPMSLPADTDIASEIFSRLASELRCSILLSLNKKPASESILARDLGTSPQDVFRNMKGLIDEGLVKKEGKEFHLTEFGIMITDQIPYFILMKKLSNFFLEDHALSQIPDKFLKRITVLRNCEIVTSITSIFERLKKLEMGATRQLKIVVPQAWVDEGNILVNRAINGVEVSYIIGRNTVFPKEVIDSVRANLERLGREGKIKRRMVEKVDIAVYIADGHCAAMFANRKGEIDMNTLFIGNDPSFYEWCLDVFNDAWSRAGLVSISPTQIV